jgi:hypothetical protein
MVSKPARIFVFHPFLFAIYFVLGAYSQNASQVPIGWISRPIALILFITIVVYVYLLTIFKDQEYAGFASTLFINWLFLGHLYRFLLERSSFWRTPLGGLAVFLLISIPLGFLASKWAWNALSGSTSKAITTFLNVASISLIVIPLWTTITIFYKGHQQLQAIKEQQVPLTTPLAISLAPAPDIYVIIVDGYGRANMLHDVYGYDNGQFVAFLKEKGFYVADQATSNYPQTQLSVSSLLNFDYLNEHVKTFGDTNDRTALYELVQHPAIRQLMADQGYKFVALPSTTLVTQIRDADIYFNPITSDMNEFETFLLSSTVIEIANEAWGVELPVMGYDLHHNSILFSLQKLREMPKLPGPKFVFAHIMLPHPPFIFDHNGNFVPPNRPYIMWDASLFPGTTAEYQRGYTEQVTFLNHKLTEIISDILAQSSNPPIIILQGDHGPGAFFDMLEPGNNSCLCERFSILNAYYFPDGEYRSLYPSITPVNSFRVILNQYFGAQLSLLEDKNYYATWVSPYLYTDVTDETQLPCDTSGKNLD